MQSKTILFGRPIMAPVLIPVEHKATPKCIDAPFMVNGVCHRVTAMSFGSPHGAVFVDNVDIADVPTLGFSLGTHPLFPKGASIVFIQVLDKENIKVRLWQKGEGETAFAPEAACVAGTTTMMLQKTLKKEINVFMGGKSVRVEWDRGDGEVTLSGLF